MGNGYWRAWLGWAAIIVPALCAVAVVYMTISAALDAGTATWLKLFLLALVAAAGLAHLATEDALPKTGNTFRDWLTLRRMAAILSASVIALSVLIDFKSLVGPSTASEEQLKGVGRDVKAIVEAIEVDKRQAAIPLPDVVQPPSLEGAFLFTGTELNVDVSPATVRHFDKRGMETRKVAGLLYIYALYASGEKYLVGVNPADSGKLKTSRVPDSLIDCGIVAIPGKAGRYMMKRQTWSKHVYSTEIRYDLDDYPEAAPTEKARACEEKSLPLETMRRPHASVDEKDLPFPMLVVFAIVPHGENASVWFTTSNVGLHDRVSNGGADVYAKRGGKWVFTGRFRGDFHFEDAFDREPRAVPAHALSGEAMAVCTYRTEKGETFAAWSEFLPQPRFDKRYRSAADTVYRYVDGAKPCDDFALER